MCLMGGWKERFDYFSNFFLPWKYEMYQFENHCEENGATETLLTM